MKKGMGWPIGIVAILSCTVLLNIGVIVFTGDDPSFAVEPDYYRKAVAWDSTQAQAARSVALHWTARAEVTSQADGSTVLRITLVDANDQMVPEATISGELLHVARASDVQQLTFASTEGGAYEAAATMQREGLWELRLVAERDADRFVKTLRIDTGHRSSDHGP
jgi:nitrogen fixation protein FixH